MNKKKNTTIGKTALALFLALSMTAIGPMQDLSAGGVRAATADTEKTEQTEKTEDTEKKETGVYGDVNTDSATGSGAGLDKKGDYPEGTLFLRDVRYFHGKEGKERAEKEGWILHDTDLNIGNKGDSLWLGYKTTTDPKESITALKTMEMNGGYELTNYRKLMETTAKGLSETAGVLMTAAGEFGENVKKGYHAATASKGLLNLFTLKEGGVKNGESVEESRLVGNYLSAGNYKSEDMQELLMQVNTTMLSTILGRLAGGVFVSEENFATMVQDYSAKLSEFTPSAWRTMDTRYQSTVLDIKTQLQRFSKDVRDAKARAKSTGGKIILSDGTSVEVDPDATGTEGGSAEDFSVEQVEEQSEKAVEEGGVSEKGKQGDSDLVLLSGLNVLNRYQFDDGTKLGDRIVELGEYQFTKLSEVRQVYPLVMAMTPGQVAIVRLCGFSVMTEGLMDENGVYTTLEKKTSELKAELDKHGYSAAPVWSVEDLNFYRGNIAYTEKLLRANAAGANFTDVTKTTALGRFWNEYQMASGLISGICSAVFSVGAYCVGISSPIAMIAFGASLISKSWATTAVVGGIIKGVAAIGLGVIGLVGIAILVIGLLVWLGKEIYNAVREWDEYSYKEEDIPIYLLDADETRSGDMSNVRYYLVTDPDENRGDLNCGKGKRWNALYYTRSEVAGDPICASDKNDFFKSVMGEMTEKTTGFEGVCNFTSPNAQSVNAYAEKKNEGNHYLYYRTSLNGEMREVAKGREEKSKGGYLADIRLFSGATETEAKAALTREGYKLYDVNVSPKGDKGRQYSYIGYKTTNNKNAAVRDIRVCLDYPGSEVRVGDISYSPGQGENEHTDSKAFLCHTKSKDYGSPIGWENVFFITKLSEAKPGWEPVSLTCGGPAFNWHDSNDGVSIVGKDYWEVESEIRETGLYMFYKPDEVYTDGEEYISGIQFVSGGFPMDGIENPAVKDYIADMGAKPLVQIGEDVGRGVDRFNRSTKEGDDFTDGKLDCYDIWMSYTTTHNPYRALTDVKYYRSAYAIGGLTPHLTVGGVGYAVCENYQNVINREYMRMSRTFAANHAYLGADLDGAVYFGNQKVSLNFADEADGQYKPMEYRGLYVSGYSKTQEPLKVSDLEVTSDSGPSPGFGQIGEFLNAYDSRPKNIAFTTMGYSCEAYVYLRGRQVPTRPRYVKKIIGTYFETPKDYDQNGKKQKLKADQMKIYDSLAPEQCRMQALQMGADEMVMESFTLNPGKKEEGDGVPQYYCYFGVSRTDNEAEAMRGALKYRLGVYDIKKQGNSSVRVSGVKYYSSGMTIRDADTSGSVFAMYTTTQTDAGAPVTEISVDDKPFLSGADTVLSASSEDKGRGAKIEFAATGQLGWEPRFLHLKRTDAEKTFYSRLRVCEGDSLRAAEINALSAGCNRCIPLDLNDKSGGTYVVLGARTCGTSSLDIAIRDILCTVGEEYKESFERGGYTYYSAGKISLNEKTEYGKKIFVYYTHGARTEDITASAETAKTPTSTKAADDDSGDWLDDNDTEQAKTKTVYMDLAPITRLAASQRDFLPEPITGLNWEKILDTKGNRVDANEGMIYRTEEGDAVDNRIYLYCAHEDGRVKPGAVITETDGKYRMMIGLMKLMKR